MGIALGGLATLDPTVSANTATMDAVMIGVMAGSLAPDLDTVLKLRNNAQYIRNHRGITHSIPAVILWPLLIVLILSLLLPGANLLHLWMWTFAGVIIHVFVDIFNAYGTQALRPFTNKWIALGVINTFDYVIFSAHVLAILIWFIEQSQAQHSLRCMCYWRFTMDCAFICATKSPRSFENSFLMLSSSISLLRCVSLTGT